MRGESFANCRKNKSHKRVQAGVLRRRPVGITSGSKYFRCPSFSCGNHTPLEPFSRLEPIGLLMGSRLVSQWQMFGGGLVSVLGHNTHRTDIRFAHADRAKTSENDHSTCSDRNVVCVNWESAMKSHSKVVNRPPGLSGHSCWTSAS